jgi:tRNA threonylcarbamoyladenosine biosynthesis protein TsaE
MASETFAGTVVAPDAAATAGLGARLARVSRPGMVVLLRGPLGAGKTTLAIGFVAALGAAAATSPSFVLAHSYPNGTMPVWHLDFYRLDHAEIEALDLAQYVSPAAVTLVEWPERTTYAWPEDRIEIDLEVAGTARVTRVAGFGEAARAARAALSAA